MNRPYRVAHDPVPHARRAGLRIGAGVAGFCVAMLAAFVTIPFTRDSISLRRRCARLIAALAAPPLRLDLSFHGTAWLESHRPAVFVVNHQSIAEVPVLAHCYPADSVILARTMVGRLPLVGRLFARTGNILVDRRGGADVRRQLGAVARRLGEERGALWVFAEGTRNPDGRTIQPLKKGAFHVAAEMNGWVVPVVVSPLYAALSRPGRGVATVQVLAPERTTGSEPAAIAAMAVRTRARMQQALEHGTTTRP